MTDIEKNWLEACELLEKSTKEMVKQLDQNIEKEEKKHIFQKFYADNSYLYSVCKSYEPTDDRTIILEHKIMYMKTKLLLDEFQQNFLK